MKKAKTLTALVLSAVLGLTPAARASSTDNIAPYVTVNAINQSGVAPLNTLFTATGLDVDGNIVKYEWDFDGDGNVDATANGPHTISNRYEEPGAYIATVTVTDNEGKQTSETVVIAAQKAEGEAGTPGIVGSTETTGQAPLDVEFSITGSDPSIVYRWDHDNDGEIDAGMAGDHTVTFRYSEPGTYLTKLTITDNEGKNTTESTVVTVLPPANIENIPRRIYKGMNVSPNPAKSGSQININHNGIDAKVFDIHGKMIRDLKGQKVWDGTNKNGLPVGAGTYIIGVNNGQKAEYKRLTVRK